MKCIFNGFGQNSKENSKMKKKGSSPQSWELNKPPSCTFEIVHVDGKYKLKSTL